VKRNSINEFPSLTEEIGTIYSRRENGNV